MRVLVTRPLPQAGEWVAQLRAAGIAAEALPLMAIGPAPDARAVRDAWSALPSFRLVLFVSPNAASQFFAVRPEGAQAWPPGVQVGSPGPGTTQALRALGVPPSAITEPAADAAQFDSESLWQQLSGGRWQGAQVLLVRGASGRDWLADQLRARGAAVHALAAYRRSAPQLQAPQQALLNRALAQPREHLWHFSSSVAIDHLATLVPHAAWAPVRALATHPRIAERARALGIGEVHEARPGVEAVVACIQSLASQTPR